MLDDSGSLCTSALGASTNEMHRSVLRSIRYNLWNSYIFSHRGHVLLTVLNFKEGIPTCLNVQDRVHVDILPQIRETKCTSSAQRDGTSELIQFLYYLQNFESRANISAASDKQKHPNELIWSSLIVPTIWVNNNARVTGSLLRNEAYGIRWSLGERLRPWNHGRLPKLNQKNSPRSVRKGTCYSWYDHLILSVACNLGITVKYDVQWVIFVLSLETRHPKYVVRQIVLRDHLLTKRKQSLFLTFSFLHVSIYPTWHC
jgi:hypothetical protein